MTINAFNSGVLDSLTAHIAVLNAQGIIVAVNKAWRQFGTENGLPEPSHSLLGANYLDTCKNAVNQPDGDEANAAQAGIAAVLTGKQESFYLEYPCHSPNQQRWFSMTVSPLQDSVGGVVVSHENITERKKLAEIALRASESRFSAVIEASPVPMALNDTQGNITYLNHAFVQTLGYTQNDIPTLADWWTRAYPDQHYQQWVIENWQNHLAEAIRSNQPFVPMEINSTCKDGTVRTFIVAASALKDNFAGIHLVTLYEITERKKADALLRESEEKLRLFIHYSPSAIAMFDREMRYLAYSHRWLVDYGLGEQELTGRSHYEMFPNLPERWKECHQRGLAGVIEKRDQDSFPRDDGSVEWIRWEIYPWLTSAGDIGGIILFIEVITERVKMEEALNASEKEFRLLAESMPQIVWITAPNGGTTYLNQQWVDYTGLSLEESYGHGWNKPFHPDDQQRAWDTWQNAVNNNTLYVLECQLRRTDGVYRWWLIRGVPVFDETGKVYKWFGTCTDIHELKNSEKSLRIAAIAFESQEAMVITDAKQTIFKVNQAFTRMTGYSAEEAVGNTPALLKSGNQDKQFYDTLWETLNRDKFWTGEIWNRRKNGELYPEWLNISAVTDANGQVSNYVAAFSDITASKKLEETIHHLAFYDRLTKLPNRRLLIERLQQALNSSTRHFNHGAILFIDLDNFKELNDIRGYEVGDTLLIEVAKRLQHCARSNDMVACLGGDDFVIVLEELSRETEQAAIQAESFAEKIHAILSQPFDLQGQQYHTACSIGISLFCNHDSSVDDLLKYTDTAMYEAKKSGRNSIRFFDPATHAAMKERIALEFDLRLALPNQQFRLYYQMQVDNMGKILGAETLMRWQHPERGLVPPNQFIHLLEESGLIVGIGLWILETACAQIKRWELNDHTQHLQLAVNVSARQFRQADFVEQVCAVLAKTAINPNRLKLELTESLILEDVSGTILKIQALKDMGVHFSMDDFGTGYSSLSYLSKLPMDQLKIDQSFVCNIGVKSSDAVIVQTIIGMAKNLDMEVIAEGVETEHQRDFLERNGCTHYQGYLFSKPLPLEEIEQLLCKKM